MRRVKVPTTKQEQASRNVKSIEELCDMVYAYYLNPKKESFDLRKLADAALLLKQNLNRDYNYVTVTKEMIEDGFYDFDLKDFYKK